ncbi:sorting nexin-11 [Pholidichthys leucotaenia]
MIGNHDDEFIAVRVQDPRVQNEGTWNSYVDYKIFLHTNSKAFTAKTSCVRRRYSEFVWLRKKLQKNAGLVPVPELPGKSFFSFNNDDFLERRRKGLQVFLDKVVHMTVCLSDSQLHLFLQTQLPVGHIQDCVQGHTPYTVTDAILTYASSNQGLAQAQQVDSNKERCFTISYESMESPAPHQPSLQTAATSGPDLDPLDSLLQRDSVEIPHQGNSSLMICQKSNHLEAVLEDCGPTEATFYLGESQDDTESVSSAEQTHQRIETPVEVHSSCWADCIFEEESILTTEEEQQQTVTHPEDANGEKNDCERKKCANIVEIVDFKDNEEEEVQEKQILENPLISEVSEGCIPDIGTEEQNGNTETVPLQSEIHDEILNGMTEPESNDKAQENHILESPVIPEVITEEQNGNTEVPFKSEMHNESGGVKNERVQEKDQNEVGQEVGESDEDSRSSNESIVKVTDEESVCEEAEEPTDAFHWTEVEASNRNILGLQINGYPTGKEDEDGEYSTKIRDLGKSPDLNSSVADRDLTESSEFSILGTSAQ